jgi:hypothetical protein
MGGTGSMMFPKGWIQLHRQTQKSEVFNDPELYRLWTLLLLKANFKSGNFTFEGEEISLKAGQFITGRKALHNEYSEGLAPKFKLTDGSLWMRVKKLEEMGNIKIETASSRKYSIITILQWDQYQADQDKEEDPSDPPEQGEKEEVSEDMSDFIKAGEDNGKDLTPAPKMDKPKKEKKGKRVYEKEDPEYKLSARLFYWILQNNPKAKYPDPQKWSDSFRLIMERDNRSEEDLLALIDWSQNNDFWMSNILSPEKLRKQFDTLWIQREKDLKKKNQGSAGGSRGARKNDLLRDMMDKEARKNEQIGNNKTLFLNN